MSAGVGLLGKALDGLAPDRFDRAARALLGMGLAFSLLLLLLMTWKASAYLWLFPVAAAGVAVMIWAGRDELVTLCLVIAGFVVVARHQEGIQPEEVLYGLVYLGYLGYWFVSRFFFYRDDVLQTSVDWVLFVFLVYVTLSFGLTVLLQGSPSTMLSEWLSVSMLGFYFPVKELCARDRRTPRAVLLTIGFIGLFIVVRNVLEYRGELTGATALWQITVSRVAANEHVLMMTGLIALAALLYARKRVHQVVFLGALLLYIGGILIGLSRAVWVSYALGTVVIFVLTDSTRRRRLVVFGFTGLIAAVVVGAIFLSDYFTLISAGLLDRLFSLGTAASADLSLINRFVETGAAWDYILRNPILGYGFGVPMKYYSLIYELTFETSFIHNGYIGVWYRHGLIGFGLIYFFYFATLVNAWRLSRSERSIYLIVGLGVAACFTAEALLGNSENPFATSDKTLMIALLAGLVSGGMKVRGTR